MSSVPSHSDADSDASFITNQENSKLILYRRRLYDTNLGYAHQVCMFQVSRYKDAADQILLLRVVTKSRVSCGHTVKSLSSNSYIVPEVTQKENNLAGIFCFLVWLKVLGASFTITHKLHQLLLFSELQD